MVEPLVTLEELLVSAPMYVAQVLARPNVQKHKYRRSG